MTGWAVRLWPDMSKLIHAEFGKFVDVAVFSSSSSGDFKRNSCL